MIQDILSNELLRPAERPTDEEQEELDHRHKSLCNSERKQGKTLLPSGTYYLNPEAFDIRACLNPNCRKETSRSFTYCSDYQCLMRYESCSFECDQKIIPLVRDLTHRIARKAHTFSVNNREASKPRVQGIRSPSLMFATRASICLLFLRQKNCSYCGVLLDWDVTPFETGTSPHLYPEAPTIDHIVPRTKEGSLGLENLCVCCYRCNQARSLTIQRD